MLAQPAAGPQGQAALSWEEINVVKGVQWPGPSWGKTSYRSVYERLMFVLNNKTEVQGGSIHTAAELGG